MFNIDIDLEKVTEWSKIYLTYLVHASKTIKVFKTKGGFHLRDIEDKFSYLRGCIDDPRRIDYEVARNSLSRKYVLFNRKETITFLRSKIITSSVSEEEGVDKNVIFSFI